MNTLHDSELIEVTTAAWSTIVGIAIEPTNACLALPDDSGYVAKIALAREDGYILRLDCSDAAARLAASKFFFVEEHLLSTEDIQDTLGEIVNIIAGNIAGLYHPDGRVGLPEIHERHGQEPLKPEDEVQSLLFACLGSALRLSILWPQSERTQAA
ncbi:MAG: chemotaxis protein CheX [Planctomycetota bacterium]